MLGREYQLGRYKVSFNDCQGGKEFVVAVLHELDEEKANGLTGFNLIMTETETAKALTNSFQTEQPNWDEIISILEKDSGSCYVQAANVLRNELNQVNQTFHTRADDESSEEDQLEEMEVMHSAVESRALSHHHQFSMFRINRGCNDSIAILYNTVMVLAMVAGFGCIVTALLVKHVGGDPSDEESRNPLALDLVVSGAFLVIGGAFLSIIKKLLTCIERLNAIEERPALSEVFAFDDNRRLPGSYQQLQNFEDAGEQDTLRLDDLDGHQPRQFARM